MPAVKLYSTLTRIHAVTILSPQRYRLGPSGDSFYLNRSISLRMPATRSRKQHSLQNQQVFKTVQQTEADNGDEIQQPQTKRRKLSETKTKKGQSEAISKTKTSKARQPAASVSVSQILETLQEEFEKLRDETKAAAMKKYMRNQFHFFGIPYPPRRAICVDIWKEVKALSSRDLRTLAQQTWNSKEREFHQFAVDLLEREKFRLYADECDSPSQRAHQSLSFVRTFIDSNRSWWDTVDPLSIAVVGPLVRQYPDDLLPEMDKWNLSPVFWICRASILYQLKYKKDTDVDRLFRYCSQVAHDKEFFIQKAIGWALREYHKTDAKVVYDFVQKNKKKMSTLSVREALKHHK